jgi:hypothetical protein
MPDVDGVMQVEVLDQAGQVAGVASMSLPWLTCAERPCPRRSWAITR